MISNTVFDTRFRSALARMAERDRLLTCSDTVDPHLELAAIMKKLDGQQALYFPRVAGHETPVVGNLMTCQENCEAAFGTDFHGIREMIGRALGAPLPPVLVDHAPVQEVVVSRDIDLAKHLPILQHAPNDAGRYITAGIVVVQIPRPASTMHPSIGCNFSVRIVSPSSSTMGAICGWRSNAPRRPDNRFPSQSASVSIFRSI